MRECRGAPEKRLNFSMDRPEGWMDRWMNGLIERGRCRE